MNDLKQFAEIIFPIFIIKKCVEFDLTSFGTLK